jgi:hypothetical protein
MLRMNIKSPARQSALLLVCLLLALTLPLACGVNQDLLGNWQLVSSDEASLAPGMVFVFKSDRSLEIRLGTAQLSMEDREAFDSTYDSIKLSYSSSPDGSLTINLARQEQGTVLLRMTYLLGENSLTITDEEGVTLVFRRQ